jgi:hypothetical protein
MKRHILSAFAALLIATVSFAQPQAQGEYHKFIVKKTDDERKASKGKEWWGAGVIMFSKQDIPRTGTIKEVQPMLSNSFSIDDKFVGRVYLPKSVNQMDGAKPEAITYRIYIDKESRPYITEAKGETMPDGDWSSWLIDFPDNVQTAFNNIPEGKHTIRVEVWSSKEIETTTIYTDENDKAVAYSKDTDNKGKFWAAGSFDITK